jgi:C1A family cysteine protease
MRIIVAAVLLAVVASALPESEYQTQFLQFTRTFNKQYSSDQLFHKFNNFKYWVDFVEKHNAGNSTWEAGINEFSDLSPAEFQAIYLTGLNVDGMPKGEATPIDVSAFAPSKDWRADGAVTAVKNQGQCGSCWSFSTTGTMEGSIFLATKSLPNLAEQQLVDCAKTPNTKGCQGGWPWAAAGWAQQNGGLCSQQDYPYTGRDGTCKKTCKPVGNIKGVVQQKGEDQLLKGVNTVPVSICLDAAGGFQSYKSGIFNGPCGTQMNHAVLAVGYTDQYWMVKNSWGTGWGDKGYIYMARGKNLCGMSNVLMWPQ